MRYLLIALMLLPGIAASEDSLGRLFTTPAERASLDHLRQTKKVEVFEANKPAEAEAAPPTVPSSISVQGYVKRSDGKKGTVWVNQTPMQENSSTDEVQVGKLRSDGNQVQLKLPANGKSLNLKAGQVYVPETDSISEINARSKTILQGADKSAIGADPAQDVTSKKNASPKKLPQANSKPHQSE
jgi:hypothetical protein